MIEFKKVDLNKLNDYITLYKKSFKDFNKNYEYFKWLYLDNPLGNFVGIDCYDNNNLIGQVGGIPHEFIFNQKNVKFLISINVCVHPKYQGQWIFSKMLVKFEEIANELNFDGIIGIANKAASPYWQRSIKMKKLASLDVLVGFGKINFNLINKSNYNFYTYWNKKNLEWRLKNPLNKTFLHSNTNFQSVYSKTNFTLLNAYAPIIFFENNLKLNSIKKKLYKPIVYLGLISEFKKAPFLFNLPKFLKPSPLNFYYKFLNSDELLDKRKIIFTFLEFDAF